MCSAATYSRDKTIWDFPPCEFSASHPHCCFCLLLLSSRVPAADQMVPGPAALRPAHPGADLRPPLDEDDDDDGVAQVTGGAGRRRHPPQDHRHRLFVKHKLEQGEPLRNGSDGLKRLSGERRGLDGGSDIWTQGQQPVAQTGPSAPGRFTQLV